MSLLLTVIIILSPENCQATGIGWKIRSMMVGDLGVGGIILPNWTGGDWRYENTRELCLSQLS